MWLVSKNDATGEINSIFSNCDNNVTLTTVILQVVFVYNITILLVTSADELGQSTDSTMHYNIQQSI